MNKNKKGFTLVELIVVISILAVLALILVPSIIGYTAKAKQAVGEANAKSCYSQLVAKAAAIDAGFEKSGSTTKITIDPEKCQPVAETKGTADALIIKLDGGAQWRANSDAATKDIYTYNL